MVSDNCPMIRELDGIYNRVERNGIFHSLSFTDLTEVEQQKFLNRLDTDGLQRMCKLLANALREIGDQLDISRVHE